MENSNLIDFNQDNCFKVSSPLIPPPKSTRLSDIANNPFDKILRNIANKDDPFECNTNTSFQNNIIEEDKENVGHLISPIQTPNKLKMYKKISASPLYITNTDRKEEENVEKLPILSDIQNINSDCNVTDTSLQILSDSVLDNDESFNFAYILPLPKSPEKSNSYSSCSALNNAFIDHVSTDQVENRSSITSKSSFNPNSFNVESLGTSNISQVFPSVSSVTSNDNDNELNKAFLNGNSNVHRRCLSARKPSHHIFINNITKPTNLNNSFAGFNYSDRNIEFKKSGENYNDDSVFLEATQLAEVFRSCAAEADLNDEDISQCSPPWIEENIVFLDDDEVDTMPKKVIPVIQVDSPDVLNEKIKNENITEKSNEKKEHKNDQDKDQINSTTNSDVETKKDMENAKELLHNLAALMNNNGTIVDERKLGESLLNSLALALNIESPNLNKITESNKSINKLQRSKSDSKVGENSRRSLEKQEIKVSIPKIKTQTAAPVKLDKNLKLRNEKEKVTSTKGPLKALLPVANMAKMKKSVISKVNNFHHLTPPKQTLHSIYQNKKTSTPNEPKIKPPIAQSTPEVTKLSETDHETPLSKRHFGLAVSPLSKSSNKTDMSNVSLNNSISPKHTSGSVPNLNKSASNLLKQSANSSIPTIKSKLNRRNSASDMTTSRSNSLNRSYDNSEPIRPPVQLKRSSSFQNKSSLQKPIDNNNTVKKYGMPGTLKSLRLVKK